jgi:hypothetical protein
MATQSDVEELQARVRAIEHASRSLALARAYLSIETAPAVAMESPRPAAVRLRTEVGRVARMLEETAGPDGHSPRALEGAAEALDHELHALSGVSTPHS